MAEPVYTDLTKPGQRAIVATWAFGLAHVGLALSFLYQNRVIDQYLAGTVGTSALEQSDMIVGGAGLLFLVVVIVGLGVNARFLYLASRNAAVTTPDPSAITPGWAVGWYFVPFANFVMPYRAMKQTWARLFPDETVPGWVLLWWLCWVGMGFLDQTVDVGSGANDLQAYAAQNRFNIISGFLWLIPTALFLQIVRKFAQSVYNPAEVFA